MNRVEGRDVIQLLSQCPLFASLSQAELRNVTAKHHVGIRAYDAGTVLMLSGEVYDELMYVAEGSLVAHIDDASGKTFQVQSFTAPCLVESAILFSTSRVLPVSISTAEPSFVFFLPRHTIMATADHHPEVLTALLTDMGDCATFLSSKLRMTQFSTISQKLAVYLLDLVRAQQKRTVDLPLTKRRLAEVFGVTRPALSRVFADLGDQGVIEYNGSSVTVRELERLRKLTGELS